MKKVLNIVGLVFFVSSVFADNSGWVTRFCPNVPSINKAGMVFSQAMSRTGVFTNNISSLQTKVKLATATVAPLTSSSLPTSFSLELPCGFTESNYSRIKELARSLDFDWDKCYRFVRDNIAYTPYIGILRGPERTLLDKEGSDGDQAFLLLALLRASGYEATVVYEPLSESTAYLIPMWHYNGKYSYNAADWLGISIYDGMGINELYQQCYKKLTTSGVGCAYYYDSDSGTYFIATSHFWVQCKVDSNRTYYLDPSLKPMTISSCKNVKADMKYNRSSLISSAGGSLGSAYIRNLSTANLASALNSFCANLRSVWTNVNANASRYVGAQEIVKQTDDSYWNAAIIGTPYDFLGQSDATKNAFRAPVTLMHGTMTKQFYLDEIGSRNLWLSYQVSSMTYPKGVLKLDDKTIVTESTGSTSEDLTMSIKVDYVAASEQTYQLKRNINNTYVIPVAFDGDSQNGMRKLMMERLADVRAKGYSANDGRVVSQSLQVVGQQWAAQTALLNRLRNRLQGTEYRCFYNFGVAGWENGPFVDLKNSFSRRNENHNLFDGYALFYSALEHASLDQVLGVDVPSVSTVKVLDLANKAGDYIYFMTSNNYASVGSLLTGYPSSLVASMKSAAKNGMRYLVPKSGNVSIENWKGYGYIQHGSVGNDVFLTAMLIDKNRNGAYPIRPLKLDTNYMYVLEYNESGQIVSKTNYGSTFDNQVYSQSDYLLTASISKEYHTADPISMPSGAFLDSATDLHINSATPLTWGRSYDARQCGNKGELGYGWTHSYDMSVIETLDIDASFGADSVDAVIPTAVAIVVVDDLLKDQANLTDKENVRRWMIAALTVQWWTEHMTAKTISFNIGNKTLKFHHRDDGTYAPYPGVTATLKKENDTYVLMERHGSSYYFNTNKRLEKIVDQSGNKTTLTYSDGKLVGVSNDYGGKFTIIYSGDLITSVSDNAGNTVRYTYSNNCLTQISDPLSKNWKNSYNTTTRQIISQTDPDNNVVVQNIFNDQGQIIKQIDANGKEWTFGYVGTDESWEQDPLGRRNSQVFDRKGRLLSKLERDGTLSQYYYNGHGNLTLTINAMGRMDFCGYDGNGNVIWTAEAGGEREESFGYDDKYHLISITNALGEVTRFTYDSCHRITRRIFPDGTSLVNVWTDKGLLISESFVSPSGKTLRRISYKYGTLGLPVKKTITGVGLPETGYVEEMTYDAVGNLLTKTDANGNTLTYAYNARGQVTKITDPMSKYSTFAYGNSGRLVGTRNPRSYTTVSRWTNSGKLAATVYSDNTYVTNVYDEIDNLIKVTDERSASVTCTRDAMGRVVSITDDMGVRKFGYNDIGLIQTETNEIGLATTTIYDSLYRPITTIDSMGRMWQTAFDKLDRPTLSRNPMNKTYCGSYNKVGLMTVSTRPSGATERFGYDYFGNCVAFTNSEGRIYMMNYDALGRLLSATNALGKETFRSQYDGVGNLLSYRDGRGVRTYDYDKLNKMSSRTFDGKKESFTYDANGNMLTASNALAKLSFSYDSRDRMVSTTVTVYSSAENGLSRSYWYPYYKRDSGGLITNLFVSGTSYKVSRSYDKVGNLTAVMDWLGHKWTFSYDAAGKLTGGTSPDGVAHSLVYDNAERIIKWKVGNLAGRSITRDDSGKRIQDQILYGLKPTPSMTRRAENVYDDADRILSTMVTGVSAKPVKEIYQYDEADALVSILSDGVPTFSANYNGNGFVSSLNGSRLAYDALDTRMIFNGRLWIVDYTDPLKRPLMECTLSGSVIRYYIWGASRLLGYVDASGNLTVAHSDEIGSIVLLNRMNGLTVYKANFGPYGEDWGAEGSNPTPFAWLGGYGVMRIEGGASAGVLYCTRHRLFSTNLRRFLSPDPMGIWGGLNLYAYGDGNPMAFVDPLGLCSSSVNAYDNSVFAAMTSGINAGWKYMMNWSDANNVPTRVKGIIEAVGGGVDLVGGVNMMITSGALVAPSGGVSLGGIAVGAGLALNGVDDVVAGAETALTGSNKDTVKHKVVKNVVEKLNGGDSVEAENVATGFDIAFQVYNIPHAVRETFEMMPSYIATKTALKNGIPRKTSSVPIYSPKMGYMPGKKFPINTKGFGYRYIPPFKHKRR